MEKTEFVFEQHGNVSSATRYQPTSFGFVTEAERRAQPDLKIFELNSGFDTPYWYAGEDITIIRQDAAGCWLDSDALTKALWEKDGSAPNGERFVPLYFKAALPREGNYKVTATLTARADEENLMVFHGCRHLAWRGALRRGETLRKTFTIHVAAIIPNELGTLRERTALDLAVVGHCPALDRVEIEVADCPTLYLAGDSTMADYGAEYPYNPAACYGGWGQALDLYMNGGITVCNQAHNGRTTETFRDEGHYDLVMQRIKAGDYFLIQFGHNDQKHPHLQAYNGYPENLKRFIAEIRAKGPFPMLATPVARNTWTEQDGALRYNDLLHDHAQACFAVGRELHVPVLPMHELAMAEIERLGRDNSIPYYHVGDWTHTNDYGAVRAAGYAVQGLLEIGADFPEYLPLKQAVHAIPEKWLPIPAPLLEKPARLQAIPDPAATETGAAAQDHQAEKNGGDSLARLLDAVKKAKDNQ